MTTILPAERTPFEAIMKQVGAGLSETLPGAVKEYGQRQRGMDALEKAQSEIANANGDPMKIALAFSKVAMASPEAAKALGPIAQTAMTLGQRTKGAGDFPVGEGKGKPRGPTKQGEQPEQQVPISVSDLVPKRPSMVQNPQGTVDFQLPYGPEEIATIRQEARQKGYLPEMEERFVNDAQEFNKTAEQRRNVELSNYQQQQQERRDTLENQNAFEKYLSSHSPEFAANPDELELALKASEKYQKEPSFAARNAKVKQELRPYQAAKSALNKALQRPLFGETPEQRDLLRKRAQFMVAMGQKPQLQLMIAKNGRGEVEEAELLNPLQQDLEKQLTSISKFINPFEKVTTIDPDSPKYAEQLAKGSEMRLKQQENAAKFLSKEIQPDKDYNHPGTNLLLTRYHLMEKGAQWQEAAQIIDSAIEQGNIKLGPQQQIDYQKLGMPPLTGETYFDTIMNNIMFPVTGRQ